MEDGRVKYTRKSGKIGGAETATPASKLSHNTRNRKQHRKRVLTKWARQRPMERYYSPVRHIDRQI